MPSANQRAHHSASGWAAASEARQASASFSQDILSSGSTVFSAFPRHSSACRRYSSNLSAGMTFSGCLNNPTIVDGSAAMARIDLHARLCARYARHVGDAPGELVAARGKVLGKVVEDLGAIMRRRRCPRLGRARGGNGITDVLAVALANLAEMPALRRQYGARIIAVGTNLLAADEQLGGPVDRRHAKSGAVGGWSRRRQCLRARFTPAPRPGFEIFVHAFAAALAAETGLAIAAEADAGVEQIGRVDPDHAGQQFRRDIQRQPDRLAPYA